MRIRARFGSVLALAALIASAGAWAAVPSGGAAQPGCGSFASQGEAEEYFLEAGGSPARGVGGLDPDRDGVACEHLGAPFVGYATIGYNRGNGFLYGTATMPAKASGYPCLYGNVHYPDAARKVAVFRVRPGPDKRLVGEYTGAAEAKPESGRLLWKVDRGSLPPGRYYAKFQEKIRTHPYGANECPGFTSRPTLLPRPRPFR